jgi:hypothetical protein
VSKRYNLTFLEAMAALSKGKEVENDQYEYIYLNRDGVIAIRYMGDTVRRWWLDRVEVSARWRVVE